ncbi:MAG: family 78 glycoside hydrolase catalytic domain [Acidimicrobiia bacterium]
MGALLALVSCFTAGLLAEPTAEAVAGIAVTALTTDYRTNPLGTDSPVPRLGWQLRSDRPDEHQTAYEVRVWTLTGADDERVPLWELGVVASAAQVDVPYRGPPLRPATRYHWDVRVWGAAGQPSAWSAPAWWETALGLRSPGTNWAGAGWITTDQPSSAPQLRKEFALDRPVASARAYAFGLGWYELHLNGRKVDDRQLAPANSPYDQTLLYDTYDVTDYVQRGDNAIGAWLGNGYGTAYSQFGWRWLGPKQVIVRLAVRYRDGTTADVVTDGTWTWSHSPIEANDIYAGDVYDGRRANPGWADAGDGGRGWRPVEAVATPAGTLTASTAPPVRVTETIRPVAVDQPMPGVWVFDLGTNIAGWARLRATGPAGTEIAMHYAEDLGAGGMIDPATNRGAAATDIVVLGPEAGTTYEPRFTYHGFRYVAVTGFPGTPTLDSLDGRVVHADVGPVGIFRSSDPMVDRIHANAQRTMLNNTMSIPTDTPVRDERTPAAMDVQAYADAALQNFDMHAAYRTYLDHLAGPGPAVVGYFTTAASPDMNGTPVFLAWALYQHYGDRGTLQRHCPALAAYVDSLALTASGGIWPDDNG